MYFFSSGNPSCGVRYCRNGTMYDGENSAGSCRVHSRDCSVIGVGCGGNWFFDSGICVLFNGLRIVIKNIKINSRIFF